MCCSNPNQDQNTNPYKNSHAPTGYSNPNQDQNTNPYKNSNSRRPLADQNSNQNQNSYQNSYPSFSTLYAYPNLSIIQCLKQYYSGKI